MSYKLAVVGSRTFQDYNLLKSELDSLPKFHTIVSGGANGADKLAELYAKENKIQTEIIKADWSKGKGAGFKRNYDIIKSANAVIAFWDAISTGTCHDINISIYYKKPIRVIYTEMPVIDVKESKEGFQGNRRWLSNMWPCDIKLGQYNFQSSEAAYQAFKFTKNESSIIEKLQKLPAISSKVFARQNPITNSDFEAKKLEYMEKVLRIKFSNPFLERKLFLTGSDELVEYNDWGDTFWGVYNNEGENNLGKILMKIREEIKRKNTFEND